MGASRFSWATLSSNPSSVWNEWLNEWVGRRWCFFGGLLKLLSRSQCFFLLWCLQPGAKTSLIDFPKALRALAALGFVPPLDPLSNRGAERPRQRLWRELILLGKAGSTGWWQVRLTRILPFLSHELLSTILAWLVLWTIFHFHAKNGRMVWIDFRIFFRG